LAQSEQRFERGKHAARAQLLHDPLARCGVDSVVRRSFAFVELDEEDRFALRRKLGRDLGFQAPQYERPNPFAEAASRGRVAG
jgi:hypothetical protein